MKSLIPILVLAASPILAQDSPPPPDDPAADGAPADAVSGADVEPMQSPPRPHGTLRLSVDLGRITYSESSSTDRVDSDFDGTTYGIGIGYRVPLTGDLKLRTGFDLYVSEQATEEWREGGRLVQRNDLIVAGIDLRGELGFDLARTRPAQLNLWLGIGYLGQGFEREEFRIFSGTGVEDADVGTVEETYEIGVLTAALESRRSLGERTTLRTETGYDFVFFNEADNDLFGTLEGDGGFRWHVLVELATAISERTEIGAGIRYTFQELEGDSEDILVVSQRDLIAASLEWPDNETEQVTGHLFLRMRL